MRQTWAWELNPGVLTPSPATLLLHSAFLVVSCTLVYVAEFVYSLLTARAPKSKRDGLARKSKVSNPLWLSAKLLFLATSPALAAVDVIRVSAPPQMRGRTLLQAWLF